MIYREETQEYNTGNIDIDSATLSNGSAVSPPVNWVIGSTANGVSLGSAVQLSGLNNIFCGPESRFNFNEGSNFSVSAWFNVRSTGYLIQTSAGRHGLVGKGAFSTCNYALNLISGTEPLAQFGSRSGGNVWSITTPALALDTWHHVVGTYSGNSLFSIYYNNTTGSTLDNAGSVFNGGLGSIAFGRNNILGGNGPGSEVITQIDDVRIYNKNLSAGEVGSLYDGLHITDGLVGYWTMNEGTGSIAHNTALGNFSHYTPSLNGTIQSVSFDPGSNFDNGSLWIFVSGTDEQILFKYSGLNTASTNYPVAYGELQDNTTGSPWTFVQRVINEPLLIIGSEMGNLTNINNVKVRYS